MSWVIWFRYLRYHSQMISLLNYRENREEKYLFLLDIKADNYNTIESTAKTAEQQGPRLQQVRTCSNATAVGTEMKEEKKLLTFRRPQTDRDIQQKPSSPHGLWALKWGLGRGGSWLHPFITQVHCMHLSCPGLALPSHQVLHHCFRPWLSISATTTNLCSVSKPLLV